MSIGEVARELDLSIDTLRYYEKIGLLKNINKINGKREYTDENINYYKRGTSIGEKSVSAKFTDSEVLALRARYVEETANQIYDNIKDRCGYQTLQQILWGRYYSHLPIYDKKHKVWINN